MEQRASREAPWGFFFYWLELTDMLFPKKYIS